MNLQYQEETGRRFLTIEKTEEQEIDSVTLGMLENNEMKDILPFYFLQQNNDIEFRFDVTGYVSIQEKLAGKINKLSLLNFLRAILDVCSVCDNYMIDTEQIMLNPNYIYINEKNHQIRFVLLPFLNNKNDFFETLREMVLGLQFDRGEDCSYVTDLLQYFQRNKTFSAFAFEKMVKEIESYKSSVINVEQKKIAPVQCTNEGSGYSSQQRQSTVVKKEVIQQGQVDEQEETSEKKKGFLFFRKKKVDDTRTLKKSTSAFGGIAIPGVEDGGYSKGTVAIPNESKGIKVQKIEIDTYVAEEEDFGETELCLKDEVYGRINKVKDDYRIIRVSTNESYSIRNPITKLGRKKSVVDICILGNLHVGRLHAIIYKTADGLFIEDNGSANGTFVNDPKVKIEKKMRLNSGDSFYLGDEELVVE